jgi:hypothetical protein
MFQPSRHIFSGNYSTENGSVVFRILVIIMNDYSDRFIVSRLLLILLLLYEDYVIQLHDKYYTHNHRKNKFNRRNIP